MAFIKTPSVLIFRNPDIICSSAFSSKNITLPNYKKNFKLLCKSDKVEETIEIEYKNDEPTENTVSFLKEISTEMKMIEWPSLDRLFKQFVIVVISLVFSAVFIYSVDGVFASLSKYLFEGN
jgi:preprotein translocase SecE subunit